MSTLLLHVIRVSAFQGIDTESPILIEYPQPKGDARPIVRILGDERSGRSSLINCLLYISGNKISYKFQDILSRERCILAAELEFSAMREDRLDRWKVKISKSNFELHRYFLDPSDDDGGWIPQGSHTVARDTLKRLLGKIAVSPMKLLEMDGKRQVAWLYEMLNVPETVLDEEKLLRQHLVAASKARTEAFKDYEANRRFLEGDPMYTSWEECEKKYSEQIPLDPIKRELDAAPPPEKDRLYDEYNSAMIFGREQRRWEGIKQRKVEMDAFHDAVIALDVQKLNIQQALRDLLKKVIPQDVADWEIVTQDAIDGRKAGVYYKGKPPAQLSESELYEAYYGLCKACRVTMVLVDNVRFGKESLKTLNGLAKSGVYVMVTDLVPGKKELEAVFVNELKR